MSGLVSQELLITSKGHVSSRWQELCSCDRVWNLQEARFQACFLPVITQLPGIISIFVLVFRSIRPLTRRRPRWLHSFIQDYEKDDEQPQVFSKKRFRGWNILLLVLSAIGLTIDLISTVWPYPNFTGLMPTISWAAIIVLLTIDQPKAAPLGCLIIFGSIITTRLVLIFNTIPDIQIIDIPAILIASIALVSLICICNQPLQNPRLPSDQIAAPFTLPTSDLRGPEEILTPWQFMTVSWMNPLLSVGVKRQLDEKDVWSLPHEFQHSLLHERFRELKGSVMKRLLKANGLDLVILTALGLLELSARLSSPVLLKLLLRSMGDNAVPLRAAIVYAFIALILRLLGAQSSVFSTWYGRRCYERCRGELITMLHEKVLSRKLVGTTTDTVGKEIVKQPASKGKIFNLMKNDVYEVAQRFWDFQLLINTPLGLILSIVLVWRLIGWPALFGVSTVVCAQIVNAGITRLLFRWERVRRAATDKRLQKSSHFVDAIRHLRWYGWQGQWLDETLAARSQELKILVKTCLLGIFINFMNMFANYLFPVVAFYAYTTYSGLPLTIDVAFPALQLFSYLEMSLKDFPRLVTVLLNARVALQRIDGFMAEPDKEDSASQLIVRKDDTELRVQNASFAWPRTHTKTLHDITLEFPVGLTVVVGEVASGKTALLEALLGEMDILEGWASRPNTMFGYCTQSPWLQSMSIRDNIIFSYPYEERRYREVLDICQLVSDVDSFKDHDHSLIGENGIGLSGGQRARVALARAVYSRARFLLLDDPLSALDHQTAEAIVTKLTRGRLMEGRTIILVTHRVDLVQGLAQQLVEISAGRARILDRGLSLEYEDINPPTEWIDDHQAEKDIEIEKPPDKFFEDEKRARGGVKAMVYMEYIKAGKSKYWILLIALMAISKFFNIANVYFLKEWGEAYDRHPSTNSIVGGFFDRFPTPEANISPWLWAFLAIALIQSFLILLVYMTSLVLVYTISHNIFKNIMQRVSHATFRFYDVTPVGRLMNRLTSDVGTVDGDLNMQLRSSVFDAVTWIGSALVIAFVTPTFFVFSVILSLVFAYIFSRFLPASQSLRRLEMVSFSPLMSNFGALLQGLTIVRAFGAQTRFQDRAIKSTDAFQRMDHFFWSLQAWLMYRFDALSALSMFLLTLLALYTGVSPSLTAFVLNAAALFVTSTHTLCQRYGQLQMSFVSVERIVELTHLEPEPPGSIDPPAAWPVYGSDIIFHNATIRYAAHLQPVLHDISLRIPAGSTTALLGRTGSGKTTLALSLLATVRAETGSITLDGIDVAQCNTQALRQRITFLAQDPVLFPGSIRRNLDPLEAHSDAACAAVLQRVCGKYGWTLDTEIEAGGGNLSQGQRQLVGLARAVLRRSSVVVLDEATASIDTETAEALQAVLREELRESTIITIAHRLEAVRGADFYVRLEAGRVVAQGEVTMEVISP